MRQFFNERFSSKKMAVGNSFCTAASAIIFAIFSIVLLNASGISSAPTTLASSQQSSANTADNIPLVYTRRLANDDGTYDINDIPSYLVWLSLISQQQRGRYNNAVTTTAAPASPTAEEEEILNALNSAVVDRQQQQQHQHEPVVMRRDVRQGKSAWDVPRSGNNAIFPHIGRRSPEPQASAMSMLLQEMAEARQKQQSGGGSSGSSFGSNMMIMPRIG